MSKRHRAHSLSAAALRSAFRSAHKIAEAKWDVARSCWLILDCVRRALSLIAPGRDDEAAAPVDTTDAGASHQSCHALAADLHAS